MSNSSSSSPQQEDLDLITFCFTVLSFTGNWDTEKKREESTRFFSKLTQREKKHLPPWTSSKLLDGAVPGGERVETIIQYSLEMFFCLPVCFCFFQIAEES